MHRRAPVVALIGFVSVLVLAVPGFGALGPPGLYVTFRTDHTITVTLNDGTPVGTTSGAPTTIPPGQYNLYLDDSAIVEGPKFVLTGPGVNLATDMFYGENPSETYIETLLPSSTYTWRNDEHPGTVFTFATSGGAGGSSGSSSSGNSSGSDGTSASGSTGKSPSKDVVGSSIAKVVQFRGTLAGTVSAAGKPTLSRNGKAVTTLKSGRYTFTIQDKSAKADFTIQALHNRRLTLTGVTFVGKHTTTVTLKPGQWTFYSYTSKTNYFVVIT